MAMEMEKKELLIIIPAYNEGKNIGNFLESLKKLELMKRADILVMNDASKDDTAKIAKEHGCKVLNHVYNMGYGSGLWMGYKYALRHGYRYLIQMDADGQHDACNVPLLYEKLTTKEADGRCPDIVLGARFLDKSAPYHSSGVKKFAYALFRFLIKAGTGRRIADPTTGLQALDRNAFGFYAQYGHFDDQYPDANMIMQMILLGFKVDEIPAVMHYRTEGTSMHSGLKPVIYMFRMMFSIVAVWMRIKLFHTDMGAVKDGSS